MVDLTFEQVAALAGAVGLTIEDDELVEVTHRLNVVLSALETIEVPSEKAEGSALWLAEGWDDGP